MNLPHIARPRAIALVAALAATLLSGLAVSDTTNAATSEPVQFQPVEPYRSNDTRYDSGGRIAAGTTRRFQINDLPADTVEIVANITAIRTSGAGFLTVWNCKGSLPKTSSVNYGTNEIIPNQVTVAVSGNSICIYTHQDTDVAIDINGFWTTGEGVTPTAIAPTRLSDSRETRKHGTGEIRRFPIGTAVAPEGTTAVALNVTALNAEAPGFVTVFPCGTDLPNVSNLNPTPGVIKPNQAFVKLAADRSICIYSHAAVDLVIDVTGAFTPNNNNNTLTSRIPKRVIDSRDGTGGYSNQFVSGPKQSPVDTRILVETDATFIANLTAVGAESSGWVAVFPCNVGYTGTSNVNYPANAASSNAVMIDASNGGVCLRTHANADIILDVFSTLHDATSRAPAPTTPGTDNPAPVSPPSTPPTNSGTPECTSMTGINQVNQWRATENASGGNHPGQLAQLRYDQSLFDGACTYLRSLYASKTFAHSDGSIRPGGEVLWRSRNAFKGNSCNLAIEGWKNSPGHYRVLTYPGITRVAFACVTDNLSNFYAIGWTAKG